MSRIENMPRQPGNSERDRLPKNDWKRKFKLFVSSLVLAVSSRGAIAQASDGRNPEMDRRDFKPPIGATEDNDYDPKGEVYGSFPYSVPSTSQREAIIEPNGSIPKLRESEAGRGDRPEQQNPETRGSLASLIRAELPADDTDVNLLKSLVGEQLAQKVDTEGLAIDLPVDFKFTEDGQLGMLLDKVKELVFRYPALNNENTTFRVIVKKTAGAYSATIVGLLTTNVNMGNDANGNPQRLNEGTVFSRYQEESNDIFYVEPINGTRPVIVHLTDEMATLLNKRMMSDGSRINAVGGTWSAFIYDGQGQLSRIIVATGDNGHMVVDLNSTNAIGTLITPEEFKNDLAKATAVPGIFAKNIKPETAWGEAGVTREVYERAEKFVASFTPEEIRNNPDWSFDYTTRAFINSKNGARYRPGLGQSTTNKHEADLKAGQVFEISRATFTTSDGKKSFTLVLEANEQSPYFGYGFNLSEEQRTVLADFFLKNERYSSLNGALLYFPIADLPIISIPYGARGGFGISSNYMGRYSNFDILQNLDNGIGVVGVNVNLPPESVTDREEIALWKGHAMFMAALYGIRATIDSDSFSNIANTDVETAKIANEVLALRKELNFTGRETMGDIVGPKK